MAFKGKATSGLTDKVYLWQAAIQGAAVDRWIYVTADAPSTVAASGYIDDQDFVDMVKIGAEIIAIQVGTISDARSIAGDLETGGITGITRHVCVSNDGTTVDLSEDFAGQFPSSSTDEAIARWSGTDGKTLQDSGITINDSGEISSPLKLATVDAVNEGGEITFTGASTAPDALIDNQGGDLRLITQSNRKIELRPDGTGVVEVTAPVSVQEQSAAEADTAGFGQYWVKDDIPNTPQFTDDAGNDRALIWSGGAFHDGFSDYVAAEHIDWTSTTSNLSTSGTAATGALTVTGNILVTGTVDGRDVATDGTKLDGIEAGADVTDATNVDVALGETNGLITRTADDTFTGRTLTAGSAKLTVTNGNGVAGNPSVDFGSVASTDLSDTAALTYNADTDVSGNSWVLDEDDMSSDSATKVSTQQSVKQFVEDEARPYDLLMNGDFRIAQRGTSFDSTTTPANDDDTYLFDRWVHISDGNDAADISRDTDGSYKGDAETANKQWGLVQIVEEADCRHIIGGAVSLQFRAKSTGSAISKVRCAVLAWDGTADSVTSDVVATWAGAGTEPTWAANWTREGTVLDLTLTASYQTVTLENISIDTASAKQIAVVLWVDDTTITAGDTINVEYISCVDREYFPSVRPVRSIAQEMDLCLRYFEMMANVANEKIMMLQCFSTTQAFGVYRFRATMRVTPTINIVGGASSGFFIFTATAGGALTTAITTGDATERSVRITCTVASGIVAGDASFFSVRGTTPGTIWADAEL